MVYHQSIGGHYKPKIFPPTNDRMVKIEPFAQRDENRIAVGSFIRFNAHFRTIHELVLYPTSKAEKIVLTDSVPPGSSNPIGRSMILTGFGDFVNPEAGLRFSPHEDTCRSFRVPEFRDAERQMRDSRLEHLVRNVDAMRTRGSTISFGMTINKDDKTGYEFCQVELASADGSARDLIVCVKIPAEDEDNLSSLYINQQPLKIHMFELVQRRIWGTHDGLFIVKKYGTSADESDGTSIPQRFVFSDLKLEDEKKKELDRDYAYRVARTCIDHGRFNAGTFEEWRQSIPALDLEQYMWQVEEQYSEKILSLATELNLLRHKPRHLSQDDGDRFEDLDDQSKEINKAREELAVLRDAARYVKQRRTDLAFEHEQEQKWGLKSAQRMAAAKARNAEPLKKIIASRPKISQGTKVKKEQKSEEEELKDVLLSIMTDNSSPSGSDDGKSRRDREENQELRRTLIMAMGGDGMGDEDSELSAGGLPMESVEVGEEEEAAPCISVRPTGAVTMLDSVMRDEESDVILTSEGSVEGGSQSDEERRVHGMREMGPSPEGDERRGRA